MRHVRSIAKGSAFIHEVRFGFSPMGKELPMLVVGNIPNGSASAVRNAVEKQKKTVVYVQGNIHAGEVEGKEAILQLLRAMKQGKHAQLRKNLVMLFVPILNADGNDMIALQNRPLQHGPIAGMGQRANGQGLDINRDHIKVETPEIVAFLRMMRDYNPTVLVDLHTTNGSKHGYHLTYAPSLNPNTDSTLVQYVRGTMLPALTTAMAQQQWRTYLYGNFAGDEGYTEQGWYTFSHEPRFNNSYIGLRNRIAILSEAYSYIDFKQRIDATRDFVVEILRYCHAHAPALDAMVRASDARTMASPPDSISVRHAIAKTADKKDILMCSVKEEINPYSGAVMHRMIEESVRPVAMAEYQAFRGTMFARVPKYYILSAQAKSFAEVRRKLEAHGVQFTITTAEQKSVVEVCIMEKNSKAERVFQGHRMRSIEGKSVQREEVVPAGSMLVPTQQPLGRLVAYLLDPMSDDGLTAWNIFDADMENATVHPMWKAYK